MGTVSERSVLAYFPTVSGAKMAAGELRNMGFDTVQVERISHYGESYGGWGNYIGGGELSGMTMFSTGTDLFSGDNEGVLQEQGEGGGGDPGVAGRTAFLVTVVTDGADSDRVEKVLKKYGGKI